MTRTIQQSTAEIARDDGGVRWRIGLIALSTEYTAEADFIRMRPSEAVALHVSRVAFANPLTAENLRAMQPRLGEAASLILSGDRLDAIAYACTSASAHIGDREVGAAIAQGKPETPVITPTSGAIAGFQTMGIGRVAMLAPYSRAVSEGLADYISAQGVEVGALTYLGMEDDREIARIAPASITAAAIEADQPDCGALFISCTNTRAAPLAQDLEDRLGKPVVTSNTAMFWQALRVAGCADPIAGFGRLLREH